MYEIVTRLTIAGKTVDEKRTKFGFREWQWRGQHFTLNGVPWHFHADTTYGGRIPDNERAKIAAYWKKSGINTVHIGASSHGSAPVRKKRWIISTRWACRYAAPALLTAKVPPMP